MIMNMKQKKIKIEPRIKLNYNIYTSTYTNICIHIVSNYEIIKSGKIPAYMALLGHSNPLSYISLGMRKSVQLLLLHLYVTYTTLYRCFVTQASESLFGTRKMFIFSGDA